MAKRFGRQPEVYWPTDFMVRALMIRGLSLRVRTGLFSIQMERVMGIEPTWPAWKAGALPLSYTRTMGLQDYSGFLFVVLDRRVTQSWDLIRIWFAK